MHASALPARIKKTCQGQLLKPKGTVPELLRDSKRHRKTQTNLFFGPFFIFLVRVQLCLVLSSTRKLCAPQSLPFLKDLGSNSASPGLAKASDALVLPAVSRKFES